MTLTLALPPDFEAELTASAARNKISTEALATQLIAMALPPAQFRNGGEIVAYMHQIGLIGMWADREDMKDSTAWVRRLRDNIR